MEVLPELVVERQRTVEQIHHEGLAAADAAPEVDAADRCGLAARELAELPAPAARGSADAHEVVVEPLERLDRVRLRRIGRELAALDSAAVELERSRHSLSSTRSRK